MVIGMFSGMYKQLCDMSVPENGLDTINLTTGETMIHQWMEWDSIFSDTPR